MSDIKVWKVIDIINWGKDYLSEKKIDDARLNIELLLCKVIKCRRIDLYLNFDKPLTPNEISDFKELLKRRLNFEPLQYILGETEFMGLPFIVNTNVLIPRPETEILVEKCIDHCKTHFQNYERISIFDIGSGCGNIAVSLAKNLQNSNVTAIDVSENAIKLAKENAVTNLVSERIEFSVFDILNSPIPEAWRFDVIISNPPYVNKEEYENLQPEIKNFEPQVAVTDYSDGFAFYRKISGVAKSHLNKNGLLAFEIAYSQGNAISEILRNSGFKNIQVIKDYSGLDRVILANP